MNPMPVPITALYAGILALLMIGLGVRVMLNRRRAKVSILDGGDVELGRAIRQHGNLVEYVPFALILMAIIEINGASAWTLHALGLVLLAGRLVYLFALKAVAGPSAACRVIGMVATWGVIITAAIRAILQFATG